MSTLFDSAATRKSPSFGRGVLRSTPTHRTPYTASDYDQYLAMSASEPDWDSLAEEAAAQNMIERGLGY